MSTERILMSLNKLSVSYLSWFVLSLTRFPTNVFIFYAMQVTYPLKAFCVLCLLILDACVSPSGAPFLSSLSLSLCSKCLNSGCKSITFCGSFSFMFYIFPLSLSLCSMCLDSGCKSITFCGSFSFIFYLLSFSLCSMCLDSGCTSITFCDSFSFIFYLLSLSLSLCSMCLDSGCKSITFWGSFSFIRSCQFFSVGNILSFKLAARLFLN